MKKLVKSKQAPHHVYYIVMRLKISVDAILKIHLLNTYSSRNHFFIAPKIEITLLIDKIGRTSNDH